MRAHIWLSPSVAIVLLALLPCVFGSIMATCLAKFHVSQDTAIVLVRAIFVGGFICLRVDQRADERKG
jgi:hypothetical protein